MLGSTIGLYRRKLGLTQEQLAQKLEVTNQAVSKWETDQCCPDVQLLPRLADVLGVSLDTLFGRAEEQAATIVNVLPWEDDGDFHVVVYCGHTLVDHSEAGVAHTFTYRGPVRDIYCEMNMECGEVHGNVTAGVYVECGSVSGNVHADGYVECGNVSGSVASGGYVECGNVGAEVIAGDYVECRNVQGDITAGGYVECGEDQ